MSGYDTANVIYLVMLLVIIVAGSVGLRRVGNGRLIKLALLWLVIFAGVASLATLII